MNQANSTAHKTNLCLYIVKGKLSFFSRKEKPDLNENSSALRRKYFVDITHVFKE